MAARRMKSRAFLLTADAGARSHLPPNTANPSKTTHSDTRRVALVCNEASRLPLACSQPPEHSRRESITTSMTRKSRSAGAEILVAATGAGASVFVLACGDFSRAACSPSSRWRFARGAGDAGSRQNPAARAYTRLGLSRLLALSSRGETAVLCRCRRVLRPLHFTLNLCSLLSARLGATPFLASLAVRSPRDAVELQGRDAVVGASRRHSRAVGGARARVHGLRGVGYGEGRSRRGP